MTYQPPTVILTFEDLIKHNKKSELFRDRNYICKEEIRKKLKNEYNITSTSLFTSTQSFPSLNT